MSVQYIHSYNTRSNNAIKQKCIVQFFELNLDNLSNILDDLIYKYPQLDRYIDMEYVDTSDNKIKIYYTVNDGFILTGRIFEMYKFLIDYNLFDILNRVMNTYMENYEMLEDIPIHISIDHYHNTMEIEKVDMNSGNCTICCEDMVKGDMVAKTPCQHNYHNECLKTWLVEQCHKPICPLCRTDFH